MSLASGLPDEIEEFRATCRGMAERHFRQYVDAADQGQPIPVEARRALAEMGAYGLPFPSRHGGGDGTFLAWAVLHEEIARVLPVLGLYFQTNTLVAGAILDAGTEEQISAWVPGLFAGELSAFLAFTEPQTGTDTKMLTTRAVPFDGGWRITGTKMWISNALSADVGIVFCKDPNDDIGLFLVPGGTKGLSFGSPISIMGMRGTELSEVIFDGVEIPSGYRLGEGGQFGTLRRVMPIGKIGLCAIGVGIMQSCLEESVRYARNRFQQGHPIIDFQAIHHLIAEMVSALAASRQLTYWAARCKDSGDDAVTELAVAKLFVTNAALHVARMAISVHGVYGIATGATVERLFRDAQILELVEGTSEVQRELVMKAVRDIT